MPRSESKRAAFTRLLATGISPLEAAKRAGFKQPKRFVESLSTRAQERDLEGALSDQELAKRALRSVLQLGEGSAQVAAARVLLEHATPADHANSVSAIVRFHGRSEDTDLDGLDLDLVRRAVDLVRAADVEAIEAYAADHAITHAQISAALERHTAPCTSCVARAQAPVAAAQPEPDPQLPPMAAISPQQPSTLSAQPQTDGARAARLTWGN